MPKNNSLFSSSNREWETDPRLFADLNWFYKFNIDLCASRKNHLLDRFFYSETKIVNGRLKYKNNKHSLLENTLPHDTRGFMNPPYGEAEKPCKKNCNKKKCIERGFHTDIYIPGIADFVEYVHDQVYDRQIFAVLLLPARTDTRWWQRFVEPAKLTGVVRMLPGRQKFRLNGEPVGTAPFPSAVVEFR